MSEIVINAQNLSKNFYNFDSRLPFIKRFLKRNQITIRAVQDISFTIKRGSIVGFIGSNGAGKSTTIKMLTGTLYPSSGKLEVNGEIPFKRSINFRKKISIVVGNKLQLFQDVSAMDYFQLIGTLYEVEPAILQERIQELSNLLNVKDQLYQQVRTLSLGQKMKMAAQNISSDDMVEFILSGEVDPMANIALSYLQNLAKSNFFFVKVKDETRMTINPEDYKNDISLKGEFIRLTLSCDASEEDKAAIIRTGMQALMGEEITL